MKIRSSSLLAVAVASAVLIPSAAWAGACSAPPNNDAASTAWANKLIDAIAEEPVCSNYQPQATSLDRGACNIFAGRVLERVYGVRDFIVDPPDPSKKFYTANEIATLLSAGLAPKWSRLGVASDQPTLVSAKNQADAGRLVLAVWRNPDPKKPGHVALVGPGPLAASGSWGLKTPNSSQFKLDDPAADYLSKPLACAFKKEVAAAVELWVRMP